jgi:hypothetical protein
MKHLPLEETMSTTSFDVLPNSLPKLDVSGGNWVIFMLHFQTVVQGKGLWGHFDGSEICPVLSTPTQTSSTPSTTSIAATVPQAVAPATSSTVPPNPPTGTQDDIDAWKKNKNVTCSLPAQHLPDSTLIVMSPLTSVKTMWADIIQDYTYKSVFAQAHLH